MSLHLCTLALSSTTNVFLRIRNDSLSRKSAIVSVVMFSVVGESLISVVTVNHSEDIKPNAPFRRDIYILSTKLPAIRHITFRADVAFIPVVEINETGGGLSFEFLLLLGLIRIELWRGFTLRTFPYTSISRANADKKTLKVLSLTSLPEVCCQDSFAFFTLCLSFSMAMRTASSSELSIISFRSRPDRVSNPLMPSVSKRVTQELTDIWVISVWRPTCSDVRPVDFRRLRDSAYGMRGSCLAESLLPVAHVVGLSVV